MNHFLDIGANVGNTFDMFLLKTNEYDGYHIWCFEPSLRHLSKLRLRCRAIMEDNTHNYSITICPFALSDFSGYSRIFETIDPLGDSLFETSTDRPVELLCGVVCVSEFIHKEIPKDQHMILKIDVEGSEVRILNSILSSGFVVPRIDKMLIEFHASTEPLRLGFEERIKAHNIPIEWWTF